MYFLVTSTEKVSSPEDLAQLEPTLKQQGFLRNEDVRETLNVTREQAKHLLQQWAALGLLTLVGKGRGARYIQQ
jgi:predicted transcriptional regulator of viral defense system